MLKVDWATHEATMKACKEWHYSKSVPAGKTVKVGVWEDDSFKGVVVFSYGATPHIGSPYKLTQYEVCELTRVAMRNHKTPVSRVIAIAVKFLKKHCPGVKLIVSYADRDQGHIGAIYQAGNWVYEGLMNAGARGGFIVNGKRVHPKTIHSRYGFGAQSVTWLRANVDPTATEFKTNGKHKYLMPLTDEMRKVIAPLAKPYPKKPCAGSVGNDTSASQVEKGGATPTPALQ